MFTVLFSRLRFDFLLLATLLGLAAAPVAHADATDTCFNFLNAQDYTRAEGEAQRLLQRSDLSRTEQRDAQLCLGRAYSGMGRARDALPAFQQVEALSQTTKELAVVYNWLGSIYQNIGDLDRAELYDQRAIKAIKELGDKSGEAIALNQLAMVVKYKGEVERALALYQEALAIEPDEEGKSVELNNIAMIYLGRKDYAKADQMLRQALDIYRRAGNAHQAAIVQLNLGDTLRRQSKLKDAEKELTAGLNAIRLVGDKTGEAIACVYLARLAVDKKDMQGAMQGWYEKAEKIYREIGDTAQADEIANLLAGK